MASDGSNLDNLRNQLYDINLTARGLQVHHETVSLELPSPLEGSSTNNEG